MVDFFPKPQMKPIPLSTIIPNAIASRGMKINPWISANHPCCTLTKTTSDFQLKTKTGIRKLTIEEASRITSYPDRFQWISIKSGHERIGNSVPPKLMQAIAEHVYETFLTPLREREE